MVWVYDVSKTQLINFDKVVYLEVDGVFIFAYFDNSEGRCIYEGYERIDAINELKYYAKLLGVIE